MNRKKKKKKLGSIRIPSSIRPGSVMGGKKPKYSRKVKHKKKGG